MALPTRSEPQENEPLMDALRAKVEGFEADLMRYMRGEADWCCEKCGQGIARDEWVHPRILREQVYRGAEYGDGPAISIALMNLVRDGHLEQDIRWLVRLPKVNPS